MEAVTLIGCLISRDDVMSDEGNDESENDEGNDCH